MTRSRILSALLCSVSVLAATPVLAQDDETTLLAPIQIYGDRTTDNAFESNASIGIADAETLSAPTIRTYQDAFGLMANVSTGDWTESGFVIRGINSEGLTPGGIGAPLASFYIDGVQQTVEGTRRGSRGTFDMEQLEVYRGPQSTLTGRNALAGAIYLRSADPEFAPSGKAQLTYGEDNYRQVGVAYGDAINSTLAYRFSAQWADQDTDLSYPSYERFDKYDDFASSDYFAFRGKLLWLPTGADDTQIIFSYAHTYDSPTPDDIVGPDWSTGSPGFDARRGDVWGDLLPDYYRSLGLTELPAFQDVRDTTVDSFGIEATHEFSDTLKLTAQTGWTRSVTERESINLGTPDEILTTDGEFDQEILSQEVRLNYDDGGLRWVAGVYAATEKQSAFREQQLLSFTRSDNTADITNFAVFGEASYEFAPEWRIIGGGRIDYIKLDQTAFYAVDGFTTADTDTSFNDTVFLPKFGIEHYFGGDQKIALIYQEGYRPGGSGIQVSSGDEYSYDPENTQNLELSWRGQFMDDRLAVAANVFYQRWDNQQVEILADPTDYSTSYIANSGKSNSYGAEVEVSYSASDRLYVFSSLGLLHTEFEDFQVVDSDFSGLPFPGAPESTLAVGFRWGEDTGWFGSGVVKYVGQTMSRLEQGIGRPLELDAYTTVDASFGYAWDSSRLTAYAINLFDTEYFKYEYGPDAYATLGERRQIGLRLDYAF